MFPSREQRWPTANPITISHSDRAEVDAVIYEFKGNAREAIRALLHDLAVLAGDYEADVFRGFVRGGIPKIMIRKG